MISFHTAELYILTPSSLLMVVRFCLCELIVVVGELEVVAAAVDIHLGAQDGASHGAALNVPTWDKGGECHRLGASRSGYVPRRESDDSRLRVCHGPTFSHQSPILPNSISHLGVPGPRANPRTVLRAWMPSTARNPSGCASRWSRNWTRPLRPEAPTRPPTA